MSKTPAYKFKLGLITATIWDNNGFYSVDLSRSYKNNEGQWQSTASYGHSDLLSVECRQVRRTRGKLDRETSQCRQIKHPTRTQFGPKIKAAPPEAPIKPKNILINASITPQGGW